MTPLKRALFVVIPFFLSKTYPYTSNRNLSVQPKAAKATSMKRNTGYAFKDTPWTLGSATTWQFVYYSSYKFQCPLNLHQFTLTKGDCTKIKLMQKAPSSGILHQLHQNYYKNFKICYQKHEICCQKHEICY